jgi:site-specific recombinase XerC
MAHQPDCSHPLILTYFESLYDAQMTTKRARRTDMRVICATWMRRSGLPFDPATLTHAQAHALIAELAGEQRRGAAAIDRIIQTGRSCWAWLVAEGHAPTNPFAAIPLRAAHERRYRKKAVQGSTIARCVLREQLRYAAPSQYHVLDVLLHLVQAGVRPTEITAIQIADIDHVAGRITVRNAYGTARRTLPLSDQALAAIDAYGGAVGLPTATNQPLIGQQRGGRWSGLSIGTIRRRFEVLRDQTTAQLHRVIATEERNALALTALQSVAALLADLTLDQLRS